MNALELFQQYLDGIRRRLAWRTLGRGAALAALCALLGTVGVAAWANRFAFSEPSLYWGRIALFLAIGAALAFGCVVPLLRVNRGRAARLAERQAPEFEQRLLTLAQRGGDRNPFLELLARDAIGVAASAPPEHLVRTPGMAGTLAAAALFTGGLVWLVLSGPGWMGHGASLLWAGPAKDSPAFYRIEVTPGSRRVRRGSDQLIEARLFGFEAPGVRLKARYQGSSKWDAVPMQPALAGVGWEFLIAGLPESMEYYVEAGNVRSAAHRLTAVDLPAVKRIRVTYRFPAWSGLKEMVEDPGGDLRAVEGTEAELLIETDRPLKDGLLLFDDGTRISATPAGERQVRARVKIAKDGSYHVAALDEGEAVRISDDYFVELREERPPTISLLRPGRDAKVSPIEEVTVEMQAADDFGLRSFELRYSVNGGEEKSVPLTVAAGAAEARGSHLIELEAFKLEPGDVVSLYGVAKDARSTTQSDMYFLQAQPFEYEFQQAQSGGGQGGMAQQGENISARQKMIIAATWNHLRGQKKGSSAAEDAAFLAKEQEALHAQAESLAKRMRSRELSQTNQEFQKFATEMEAAAKAMEQAADQLRAQKWRDALPPEQKALQNLLRAESLFRQIQVAFGRQGGGGGGGGGARDLESLFDLELDTEKNTYETNREGGGEQGAGEVDEALQKLKELARRQEALAQQQRQQQQRTMQQRWAQEMLRREAEELKRRMEELAGRRQEGQQGQQAQQGAQSGQSSSQQSQSGQQGRQRSLSGMAGQRNSDPRLDRALEQLERATEDMRRASRDQAQPDPAGQQSGQQQQENASARRAAERLSEARDQLSGMRREQSGNRMDDVARRTEELAEKQRDFAGRMQQAFSGGSPAPSGRQGAPQGRQQSAPGGQDPQQNEKLANEKQQMLRDLEKLENEMRAAVREMSATQRGAASKLREALAELQQRELRNRMQFNSDYLRRGYGPYLQGREQAITEGLDKVRDQVRAAQQALGTSAQSRDAQERALGQMEQARQQMERITSQQGGQRGSGQAQDAPVGQPGSQQGRQQRDGMGGSFGRDNNPNGGAWRGGFSAMNRGDRGIEPPNRAPLTAEEAEALTRAYQDAQSQLLRLRNEAGEDPELAREMNALVREMQMLDPKKFPGNPALIERMRNQVLPGLARIEVMMRRQGEGPGGGVAGGSGDKAPDGYADKVADYFRRLSRSR